MHSCAGASAPGRVLSFGQLAGKSIAAGPEIIWTRASTYSLLVVGPMALNPHGKSYTALTEGPPLPTSALWSAVQSMVDPPPVPKELKATHLRRRIRWGTQLPPWIRPRSGNTCPGQLRTGPYQLACHRKQRRGLSHQHVLHRPPAKEREGSIPASAPGPGWTGLAGHVISALGAIVAHTCLARQPRCRCQSQKRGVRICIVGTARRHTKTRCLDSNLFL